MKYFTVSIGDYLVAADQYTWLQDCAYWRLMRVSYATEKPLPRVHARIYSMVHAETECQKRAVNFILDRHFELHEDGYHQHRIDEGIAKFHAKSKTLSENAQARWSKSESTSETIGCGDVTRLLRVESDPALDPEFDLKVNPEVQPANQHESSVSALNGHANASANAHANAHANEYADASLSVNRKEIQSATRSSRASSLVAPTITRALRKLGIAANPAHPVLLKALTEGATQRDFEIAAAQAAATGKGFAWVCAAVIGRLRDAQRVQKPHNTVFRPYAGVGVDEPPGDAP